MKDFLSFRMMISAGLIKVIYPLVVVILFALVAARFFPIPKQMDSVVLHSLLIYFHDLSWDHALLWLFFSNISWRIFCEQMILLFAIHESLNRQGGHSGKGI
jgi:hypothetical protein